MRGMRRANAGVTLMELMIVMVVIGILSAIAIPSYRGYVLRANRADAKTGLMSYAGTLERCFTRDNRYDGASCNALGLPAASGNYQIAVDANAVPTPGITATTYALKAVPLGGQIKDTQCGTFTLDDKNTRGVSGTSSASPLDCWGR
jgi:type IV pilus assembly protein PilE